MGDHRFAHFMGTMDWKRMDAQGDKSLRSSFCHILLAGTMAGKNQPYHEYGLDCCSHHHNIRDNTRSLDHITSSNEEILWRKQ